MSLYFGIDVSKRTLHLANPKAFLKEFENSPSGRQKLTQHLKKLKPQLVVLEASGGYERSLSEALQDADLPVHVAQPSSVRYFARSLKVLAKTDRIDAQVIARFAAATNPAPSEKTPENVKKLRALCDRREQIVGDRVRESNRLEACSDPDIAADLRDSIARLKQVEKDLDKRIASLREADAELSQKASKLLAQIGVGEKTTNILLAHLPELGRLQRGPIAALAGLAPHPRESGNWVGKRRIYGGRALIRKALYMAAKTAVQHCPHLSRFYQHLREQGKAYNVAIIACARKLLVRLNTILKEFQISAPPQPQ
ncbi:IS110 family transposase [Rubinisphaera sp. JC750]|uniref:IS110 family transposase n=1 Tax=Rubinisphaera sp. JC750 TaxID=2898658 RepID=UPI001F014935|nr:IS110 family transposase [Rubinisphaera sp. JC750]